MVYKSRPSDKIFVPDNKLTGGTGTDILWESRVEKGRFADPDNFVYKNEFLYQSCAENTKED